MQIAKRKQPWARRLLTQTIAALQEAGWDTDGVPRVIDKGAWGFNVRPKSDVQVVIIADQRTKRATLQVRSGRQILSIGQAPRSTVKDIWGTMTDLLCEASI